MSSTFLVQDGRLVVSPASGTLAMVTGTTKLAQSVAIALQSDKTRLWRLAIVGDVMSIRAEVARRVGKALTSIQSDQKSRPRVVRTLGEKLFAIRRVDVIPQRGDPRVYTLRVEVTSAEGVTVPAQMTLTRSG